MSSFFTLPSSQRKRKRPSDPSQSEKSRKPAAKARRDDESISGSDDTDNEVPTVQRASDNESEETDDQQEDPATKRVRLAEQYLANTRREVAEDVGFDAADVDKENLRSRTVDRLKEDTAEDRGKLYKHIADEHDWHAASCAQFRAHTNTLTGVAIAAGFVYTVSKDMSLAKWVLPGPEHVSRKPRRIKVTRGGKNVLDHHSGAILCVAASVDGKFVATGGADKRLIIWSADTLKPLKVFTGQHRDNGHRDAVLAMAFRRGSNQLFSAGKDRTVKIWSCDELAYVETLFGHQDEVLDIDALSKEVCISAGARDRTARYWRVVEEVQLVFRGGGAAGRGNAHNKLEQRDTNEGHEGSIERIAFVDDETFVTGSDNGALTLWNIHKKKAIFSLPVAHGSQAPPPLDLRSADPDPALQYQDTEALLNLQAQPRWITALDVVPFSDLILTGSWDGRIRVFKISADRRRIERVGVIGRDDEHEHDDCQVQGMVNDLAVVERGERGRDGLYIAIAVGHEHRLGRWQKCEGKNAGYLFEVPRLQRVDHVEKNGEKEPVDSAFGGFD